MRGPTDKIGVGITNDQVALGGHFIVLAEPRGYGLSCLQASESCRRAEFRMHSQLADLPFASAENVDADPAIALQDWEVITIAKAEMRKSGIDVVGGLSA